LSFDDGLEIDAARSKRGYTNPGKWRLVFDMRVPREADGTYRSLRDYGAVPYGESAPEISVADNATPERIAKEIERRLIVANDLRGKLAKVVEVQASRAAFKNGQHKLARELMAFVGHVPEEREFDRDRNQSIRLYDFAPGVSYGSLEVSGADSVKIDVRVNGAVAKAFLEMLAARRQAVAHG
jgi:hypothetical protein